MIKTMNIKIKNYELFDKHSSIFYEYENLELYKDFGIYFINKINETFLGYDSLSNKELYEYFVWVYGKTLEQYDELGFDYYFNDELFIQIKKFTYDNIFDKKENELNKVMKKWKNIFSLYEKKSVKEKRYMLKLYKIFKINKTLKNYI